jgi:TatD DNase family protein
MPLVDTHCHLNFERYDNDREDVVARARAAGVTRIIIPAIDIATTYEALGIAAKYDGIYAAAGIHPNSTKDFTEVDRAAIEELAGRDKIVAIGEIGLDYHWDKSPVEKQKEAFRAQLDLAAKLALPVIIHNREASDDVMDMLEAWVKGGLPDAIKDRPGVLHSFSAPQSTADRALAIGFYLGFTGPVTFRKADDLREIVDTVPEERLLVETDGPFLTPEPYRGKRNEPAYVKHIAGRIAKIKDKTEDEITAITTANAERLFAL